MYRLCRGGPAIPANWIAFVIFKARRRTDVSFRHARLGRRTRIRESNRIFTIRGKVGSRARGESHLHAAHAAAYLANARRSRISHRDPPMPSTISERYAA